MAFLNHATREIHCKIVYYGPGFGGKTTNLEWIYDQLAGRGSVELTRLATDGDRTLFFDLLPLDLGNIYGYRTRLHLYTVPGQPRYNSSRKIVLQGVDGLVFVADSHPDQLFWNRVSLENLRQNLMVGGRELAKIPMVMQYNKRDLRQAVPVEQLERLINVEARPVHLSVATEGQGVLETLRAIVSAVVGEIAQAGVPAMASCSGPADGAATRRRGGARDGSA
jgi:signal recognition particle receptor subunit beta